MNYRIREKGKKINIFDKINQIKKDIKALLPEIEDDRLLIMFSHTRRYYEGKLYYGRRTNLENLERKRELTEAEKIVYDYLLKNKLNPSTAYRWFLACRVPSDVKEKLVQGRLSYKKALQISANRKRVRESNTGLLMVEEINNIIQSL
jgi:hypothetical protein